MISYPDCWSDNLKTCKCEGHKLAVVKKVSFKEKHRRKSKYDIYFEQLPAPPCRTKPNIVVIARPTCRRDAGCTTVCTCLFKAVSLLAPSHFHERYSITALTGDTVLPGHTRSVEKSLLSRSGSLIRSRGRAPQSITAERPHQKPA